MTDQDFERLLKIIENQYTKNADFINILTEINKKVDQLECDIEGLKEVLTDDEKGLRPKIANMTLKNADHYSKCNEVHKNLVEKIDKMVSEENNYKNNWKIELFKAAVTIATAIGAALITVYLAGGK